MMGIYAWSKETGWIYHPAIYQSKMYGVPTGLYLANWSDTFMNSTNQIEIGFYGGLSVFNLGALQYENTNRSFIYFSKLPQKIQIKAIELIIGNDYSSYLDPLTNSQASITVSIGDGNRGIYYYNGAITGATSTTTIATDGSVYSAEVGMEVCPFDGPLRGERTWINSIANKGTANEVWTVYPALSATTGSPFNIRLLNLRKTENKIVNIENISDPLVFYTEQLFLSDKLFIEVVINYIDKPFPVSIMGINIY
jgi:hypothetical protein